MLLFILRKYYHFINKCSFAGRVANGLYPKLAPLCVRECVRACMHAKCCRLAAPNKITSRYTGLFYVCVFFTSSFFISLAFCLAVFITRLGPCLFSRCLMFSTALLAVVVALTLVPLNPFNSHSTKPCIMSQRRARIF